MFTFRLRLFRCKTFSTVKCLQIQIIYGKMFVFSMFVCILKNTLKNILQYLEQRKMKIKKNQKPQSHRRKSTTNHRKTTHKPTITTKPTPSKPKTNKSKPTNHHNHEQHRFLAHEHIGERDGGTSTSTLVLIKSGSGPASIADRFSSASIWGGFSSPTAPPSSSLASSTTSSGPDLGRRLRSGEGSWVPPRRPRAHRPYQPPRQVWIWGVGFDLGRVLESHRAALELTSLINHLVRSGSGAAERESWERAERERELRKRVVSREQNAYFGKWFTEKFSVNHFPIFPLPFSGQQQIFSVDFWFYSAPNVRKCWKRFTENVLLPNKLSLNEKCYKMVKWETHF